MSPPELGQGVWHTIIKDERERERFRYQVRSQIYKSSVSGRLRMDMKI